MSDATVSLRPLVMRDVPRLVEICNQMQVARYLAHMPHPFKRSHAKRFVTFGMKNPGLVFGIAFDRIGSVIVTTPGGYATFTLAITPVITVTEIRLEAFGNGFMSMDNANLQIACFTRGSQIKTQSGEVAIEDLAVGDRVETLDHGLQPIRWIGSSKCQATGNMAPILIRKGALGNTRDLRVSPQHRMLLSGWHAEVLFGEREVLATAKSLVNDHSILREEGDEVEYFHMLFDTHEIVYAEGAPSESFHPGAEGWKALDKPTRNEILELFPQLANGNFDSYGPSARASLKYKEGSLLSHSMISQTQH